MTSDHPVMVELSRVNPVSHQFRPDPVQEAEAERVLRRVLSSPPPPCGPRRRLRPILAPAASMLVVLAVVALFLRVGSAGHNRAASGGQTTIVLQAQPTGQTRAVTPAAMSRDLAIVRERLSSVGHGFRVSRSGADGLVVSAPGLTAAQRARIAHLVTAPGRLTFSDWEANALTAGGQRVASRLRAGDPDALAISQGVASGGPGSPGAGGLSLYGAVTLAARRPTALFTSPLSRSGDQQYLFGAPGSPACAAAANANHATLAGGEHCLLAGPVNVPRAVSGGQITPVFKRPFPAGAKWLVVPQGTVVLQAANPDGGDRVSLASSAARFFVLLDNVSLFGDQITHPRASTDQSGSPDVQFGFTPAGRRTFQKITAQIAHRGLSISTTGRTYDQHFAVALDNQLLVVAQVDFKQYPDGIIGSDGADVIGGLTTQSAHDIATELRYGALALPLRWG